MKIASIRRIIFEKYYLNADHDVMIFLDGIQLPEFSTLMDVAYIAAWKRVSVLLIFISLSKT